MVKVKRVYEPPSRDDGKRILIDRLWPRGLKKTDAVADEWMKELAPSAKLRIWFAHDPGKYSEFKKRFFRELAEKKDQVDEIMTFANRGTVTLLYGSKEERYNNAAALKEYLEGKTAIRKKAA
ncbi:MAG TPA: DUF488 family protein [Nitrospirota bacterium]|nr:DUF488 family protein [Nitrospirota bacterium]